MRRLQSRQSRFRDWLLYIAIAVLIVATIGVFAVHQAHPGGSRDLPLEWPPWFAGLTAVVFVMQFAQPVIVENVRVLVAADRVLPRAFWVGRFVLIRVDTVRGATDRAFGLEGSKSVDRCSVSYKIASVTTSTAMLAVGTGRLGYAGAAKGMSLTATTAEEAIQNRNALKVAFRLGLDQTSRVYATEQIIARYGEQGAIAAAGRTNIAWNLAGAGGVAGAVNGFFNLPDNADCK